MKHFRRDGRLIETRLLVHHDDGGWGGYSYEWNARQNDATLRESGATEIIGSRPWIFPARDDCPSCHNSAAKAVLGAETVQLNAVGFGGKNQLDVLAKKGWLDLPRPAAHLPALPNPFDASVDLEARARTYLHANCSQCHRPGGPTNSTMDLRYIVDLRGTTLPLAGMHLCGEKPAAGSSAESGPIVTPADPDRSSLYRRMVTLDPSTHMPPLGSSSIDRRGAALIREWIASRVVSCP